MKTVKDGFVVVSRAWYGKDVLRNREVVDEICIGRFYVNADGQKFNGQKFEWLISFYKIDPCSPCVAKIEMYDDAWSALVHHRRVFNDLAGVVTDGKSHKCVTVDEVVEILMRRGFVDMTPIKRDR